MPDLIAPDQRFREDDGAADPSLAAALTAYAAGQQSEHAVLAALARARLLVPVVAAVCAADPARDNAGRALRREKTSEMALPTLAGRDGRQALIAFTCLSALSRWRTDARPLPVEAARVCQAATAEAVPAVVVDVAGPVPLVVEGARLAALAAGRPAPRPADDPDVRAVVEALARADPGIMSARVLAGTGGSDLTVRLVLARGAAGGPGVAARDETGGPGAAARDETGGPEAVARNAAAAIMAALGGRFRRGIEIAVVPAPQH